MVAARVAAARAWPLVAAHGAHGRRAGGRGAGVAVGRRPRRAWPPRMVAARLAAARVAAAHASP